MSFFQNFLMAFAFVAAVQVATADMKSKVNEAFEPVVQECAKEFSISEDDLKAAKESGKFNNMDPCFHACLLKKSGLLDNKGMYVVEAALTLNKKIFGDEQLDKATEIVNKCVKVNDMPVSDGDKGCDRAVLVFKCLFNKMD